MTTLSEGAAPNQAANILNNNAYNSTLDNKAETNQEVTTKGRYSNWSLTFLGGMAIVGAISAIALTILALYEMMLMDFVVGMTVALGLHYFKVIEEVYNYKESIENWKQEADTFQVQLEMTKLRWEKQQIIWKSKEDAWQVEKEKYEAKLKSFYFEMHEDLDRVGGSMGLDSTSDFDTQSTRSGCSTGSVSGAQTPARSLMNTPENNSRQKSAPELHSFVLNSKHFPTGTVFVH